MLTVFQKEGLRAMKQFLGCFSAIGVAIGLIMTSITASCYVKDLEIETLKYERAVLRSRLSSCTQKLEEGTSGQGHEDVERPTAKREDALALEEEDLPEHSSALSLQPRPSLLTKANSKAFHVAQNFRFELLDCKLTGAKLVCDLEVLDLIGHRDLTIRTSDARVVTEEGEEVAAAMAQLGTQSNTDTVKVRMLGSSSFRLRLVFDDVQTQARSLKQLVINEKDRGGPRPSRSCPC